MFKEKRKGRQREFWVMESRLPELKPGRFYELINETLGEIEFEKKVWERCAPYYAEAAKGGRPGIDPVVYFKMMMIGFFENITSQRDLAARCGDSLSLRAFLGYSLEETTPEHSSLTVIRKRLPQEVFDAVFKLILEAMKKCGLLRGKNLGIDSSVIEANASLRSLVGRNTEQSYWDYVKELAKEAGVDPEDAAAVRNFDRKRDGRKTSNDDWKNPHDPDAKIGKTKDGATDMIYKPEHVVDLDTGTIVEATVLPGDQGDSEGVSERVLEAMGTLHEIMPEKRIDRLVESATADKGYFALTEVEALQEMGLRTVIPDAKEERRRKDKLTMEQRQVLSRAKRSRKSQSGRALLRRRGERVERSFGHILDAGGMRRTTLRGMANQQKRYKLAAAYYNLSQLLRKKYGVGTPKQWVAVGKKALCLVISWFRWILEQLTIETSMHPHHFMRTSFI